MRYPLSITLEQERERERERVRERERRSPGAPVYLPPRAVTCASRFLTRRSNFLLFTLSSLVSFSSVALIACWSSFPWTSIAHCPTESVNAAPKANEPSGLIGDMMYS
eukprot:TRINITY_DN7716_c0_g1_i6.p1 TRINITY_DN7716_c0_g1~~TRINITY_DN7716_c0_g1_i6.p1  ORF type:complete len:108 (-),score=0.37 TRINITY_DN7716_c0_g1_i6:319-642(-)